MLCFAYFEVYASVPVFVEYPEDLLDENLQDIVGNLKKVD